MDHHGPYAYQVKERSDSTKKAAETLRHLKKSIAAVIEANKEARRPTFHSFALLEGPKDVKFYKKFLDSTVARRSKVSLIICGGRGVVIQALQGVKRDIELTCSTVRYLAFIDKDHDEFHPESRRHWRNMPPWLLYVTTFYSYESYCVPREAIGKLKEADAWIRWWSLYCAHRKINGLLLPCADAAETPEYPVDIESRPDFCRKTFAQCRSADPRLVWRGKNLLSAYCDHLRETQGGLQHPDQFISNATIPDRLHQFLHQTPGIVDWLKYWLHGVFAN